MKNPIRPVTALSGVYASGMAAGIKSNGKKDLAFLFVPDAYGSAGVFTQSAFAAPPVELSRKALQHGTIKAVIVNAGNANAGTGKKGLRDAQETASITAKLLGFSPSQVAVASTGVIGKPLPMERIRSSLPKLLANRKATDGGAAAQAILTTDLTRKEVYCTGKVAGERITVAGFAKGSGMIAPNMATMLGFLVTDAKVDSATLKKLLKQAADASFNMTSVDTDTSTNDALIVLSTGKKGPRITSAKHQQEFLALLTEACCVLARSIAADGEGATKLIEVKVNGARNLREARCIAKNIVSSPLVKTAIHGADPNWGRVLAAAGKDPTARVDPNKVDLTFAGAPVMRRGVIVPHDRNAIHKLMSGKEVHIHLHLHLGKASATAWGCDLTHGYVDINVSYS